MELSTTINTYEELRTELNKELYSTAQSVCRIGYLLKVARDTEILNGTSYTDVNDFATAEFGLDKSQVSRFIRINDRFSVGGNSEMLLEEYKEYGSAKLSLMLLLPDEINEELTPEYSKSEIAAIKDEYEEEQKITDIEVMLEEHPELPDTGDLDEFIVLAVKELNDEHPEPISDLHFNIRPLAEKMGIEPNSADAKEAYMPDGDRTYNIRISGQGRFMVNMKEEGISIVNMRDPANKTPFTWDEFMAAVTFDEEHRDFTKPIEAEKTPAKPKRVEKSTASKSQSVRQESGFAGSGDSEKQGNKPNEDTPNANPAGENAASRDFEEAMNAPEEQKTAPTLCQPADPVDVWKDEPNPPQEMQEETAPAAGLEKVEGETGQDEAEIIHKLYNIVHNPRILSYVNELKPFGRYRDNLDYIGEWAADITRTVNKLYAELGKREM